MDRLDIFTLRATPPVIYRTMLGCSRRVVIVMLITILSTLVLEAQHGGQTLNDPSKPPASPIVIRVGVSEYQNLEAVYELNTKLFQQLSTHAPKDQPVTFQVAVGGYQEVLDWWDKKEIDAAVMAATPTATLFKSLNNAVEQNQGRSASRSASAQSLLDKLKSSYIATVGMDADYEADSPLQGALIPQRRADLHREINLAQLAYHTVAVVKNDEHTHSIGSFEELLALKKPLKFLFVRPYSASGYILPRVFLDKLAETHSELRTLDYEYTFKHSASLDRLLVPNPEDKGKILVAFVYDIAVPSVISHPGDFKVLQGTAMLDAGLVPYNILLVNYNNSDTFDRNRSVLMKLTDKEAELNESDLTLVSEPQWEHNYDQMQEWLRNPHLDQPIELEYQSTIDDILDDMVRYSISTQSTPRLALVLSGGGAKCAYQAGAIAAIESKLEQKRQQCAGVPGENDNELNKACSFLSKLDINLVVGTSGGSINALFVALGTTKNPLADLRNHRPPRLEALWMSLTLDGILSPSERLSFWLSVWFGLVQCLLVCMFAVAFTNVPWTPKRVLITWGTISAIQVLIAGAVQLQLTPTIRLASSLAIVVATAWTLAVLQRDAQSRGRIVGKVFLLPICGLLLAILVLAAYQRGYTKTMVEALVSASIVEGICICLSLGVLMSIKWILTKLNVAPDWWSLAGWAMLTVSVLELIFAFVWEGRGHLPMQLHMVEHVLVIALLPFRIKGVEIPIPIIVGATMLLLPQLLRKLQLEWEWDRKQAVIVGVLAVGAIAVATTTSVILFEKETAPTDSNAVVELMAKVLPDQYSDIVGTKRNGSATERLRDYSKAIIQDHKIVRDVVITASRLHSDAEDANSSPLPDDLYFYYQVGDRGPAPGDSSFISFEGYNADKLLDAVIGSGVIYPVFPPMTLNQLSFFDRTGKATTADIPIVDGGFIHNSPIDAAQKWGATHIILIEASPRIDHFSTDQFSGNIANAFNYLFDQAQSRDRLSKAQTELYVLRPTCNSLHVDPACPSNAQWNMDLFDFSLEPIETAIFQGWYDVDAESAPHLPVTDLEKGKSRIATKPLFTRQAGSPLFRNASDSVPKAGQSTN